MKKIFARYKSICNETGAVIPKYTEMYYDFANRKCYAMHSETAKEQMDAEENDADNTRAYIEAQENAYCDNRYPY